VKGKFDLAQVVFTSILSNSSITQGSRSPKKNIWIPTFVGMTWKCWVLSTKS